MAKKGENIYLRKDGRWEGRYVKGRTERGKTRFGYVYGECYRDVKGRLTVLKAETITGRKYAETFGDGTLSAWLDYWLYVRMKSEIKESTFQLYVRLADKHILPNMGKMPLFDLDEEHIRALERHLKKSLSTSTAANVLRLLKAALRCAQCKDLIRKNPFDTVRIAGGERKSPRVLTATEQERLERSAVQSGSIEYLLMLYTGLRLGETCALVWDDVDFDNGTITVCNTVQRVCGQGGQRRTRLVIGEPKSAASAREIPIPVFLCAMLKGRFERLNAQKSNFVLASPRGGGIDPRTIQNRFSSLAKQLGIDGAHVHTLRHPYVKLKTKKHLSLFPKNEPHAEKGSCMRLISDYMMDSKMSFTL